MNHCPCNNCVCIPMCRLKQYTALLNDCFLIRKYIEKPFEPIWVFDDVNKQRKSGRLGLIHKALKPTMWILIHDEYGRAMVDNYTGYEQCHFIY